MKKFFEWLGIQDAFEQGLIARILTTLCLVFVVFGIVFLTIRIVFTLHPAYPAAHWTDILIESLVFIVGLIALLFIRSGNMRAASRIILGGLLFAVTLQAYFLGDPSNDIAGAMGLQLFAILAILMLDRWDRWIAISLVIIVYVGLNILSTSGYLLPVIDLSPMGKTLFSSFVWLSVSIIIAVVLGAAMGAMRREPQLLQQQFDKSAQIDKGEISLNSIPYLSTHDALTGLYNRLFFETEFNRLEKSRLFPISIIKADIDELRYINESHGYKAGDEMLINVARLFSKVFRQEDIISRYGGDEFMILLPGADSSIAKKVVGRINNRVSAFNKKQKEIPMRISMGVSTANQGDSLKTHLKLADKLLRQEKNQKS